MSQAFVQEKKYDSNNQPCALIVVENVDAGGFRFHFKNSWSEVQEFQHNGRKAYKIWVSARTRNITITNDDPSIGELKDYTFPIPVQAKKTYIMKLATVYGSSALNQTLKFNLNPADSKLFVNEEPWNVVNGEAYRFVKLGTYNYRVESNGYITDAGIVEVIDPNAPKVVDIQLRKETSTLTISNVPNIEDANIFVDGASVGKGAVTTGILSPGKHTLVITKPHYKNYTQEFVIQSGKPLTIEPQLVCIAAKCTISIAGGDRNTEIWVNNEHIGNGASMECLLDPGANIVEARRKHHTTNKRQVDVNSINVPMQVTLQAPIPITGSLSVESNVKDAEVWIDGEKSGTTPYLINNIIEGNHKVEIRKSGYKPASYNVDIKEGTTSTLKGELSNMGTIKVYTHPSYSDLKVNGKRMDCHEDGKYVLEGVNGTKFHLKLYNQYIYGSGHEYTTATKTVKIGTVESVHLTIAERYVRRYNFYIGLGGIFGSNTGGIASIGWNINNFNMQFDWEYDTNDEIVYLRPDHSDLATECKFKPSLFNVAGKIGGSINIGRRLAVTPQIGVKYMKIEDVEEETYFDTYSFQGTASLRIYLATGAHFGFFVTPEYSIILKSGDGYNKLSEYSEAIKKMGQGLSISAGFAFNIY